MPSQHCLLEVFMKMHISTKDRLLGLLDISVWSCGSGRAAMHSPWGTVEGRRPSGFPLNLLEVMESWCLE